MRKKIFLLTTVFFVLSMMFVTPVQAETQANDMIGNALESTGVEMTDVRDLMKVRVQATPNSYPAKYDPRTTGMVTSVKNQGTEGLCWDYAIQAAAESYLVKTGKENNTIDLSELYFLYDLTIRIGGSRESFNARRKTGGNPGVIYSNKGKLRFALESDYPISDISDDYSVSQSLPMTGRRIEESSYRHA